MNERDPADVESIRDTTKLPAAGIGPPLAGQRGDERCIVRESARLPARAQIPRAAGRPRLAIGDSLE